MLQVENSSRIQPYQNLQVQSQTGENGKITSDKPFQELQKGDIIEGRVLSAGEKSIVLELDGKAIEAKLEGNFEFVKGELVQLVVAEATPEKLLLKSVLDQAAMSNKRLEDILTQLHLKLTPENKAMVAELMGAKLPLSQENLKTLQLMMSKYPEVDIKSMVLLLKNGIELNDEAMRELLKTKLPSEQLTSRLEELIGKLAKAAAGQSGERLLSQLTKDVPEAEELLRQLKMLYTEKDGGEARAAERPLNQLLGKAEAETLVKELENWQRNIASASRNSEAPASSENKFLSALATFSGEEGLIPENSKNLSELLNTLKQSFLQGDFKDASELLKAAKGLPEELRAELKQILSERLGAAALRRTFFLNGRESEPTEHLERLFERLSQFKSNAESPSTLMREALQDATSARSALGFMEKFQGNAGFVQLPFLLGDKALNGELFVLNNKKKGKEAAGEDISALLQLEFATLGHVDTFIRKEQQRVQIDFYAEDVAKEKWIREKIYLLHNNLLEKNYQITAIRTFVKKDKTDGFADFLANEEVKKVSRFSFDMKA